MVSFDSFFAVTRPFCDVLQHVQVEHSELINQVDAVRDCALDLMNRSDKYHKMVEPELTALNQRWEEVSTRLKVNLLSRTPSSQMGWRRQDLYAASLAPLELGPVDLGLLGEGRGGSKMRLQRDSTHRYKFHVEEACMTVRSDVNSFAGEVPRWIRWWFPHRSGNGRFVCRLFFQKYICLLTSTVYCI